MASGGKKTTPRARIKTADLMELFSECNYVLLYRIARILRFIFIAIPVVYAVFVSFPLFSTWWV